MRMAVWGGVAFGPADVERAFVVEPSEWGKPLTLRRSTRFLLLLLTILVSLLAAEGLGQVYAYKIAERGRLFEADATLGWRPRPDLNLTRRNADGVPWHIETDDSGIRGPSSWKPAATRRFLVLGDSYAFGEGVDLEARFDRVLAERRPDWSFISLGVMGYGTDQQLLAARPFLPSMRPRDTVLTLTFWNDFVDVLRERFAGRAKPYFEQTTSGIVEHPPTSSWFVMLRDRSYLVARLGKLLEGQRSFTLNDLRRGADLYRAMLEAEAAKWSSAGLRAIVAHHGLPLLKERDQRRILRKALAGTCAPPHISCIDLATAISAARQPEYFLSDGHWNRRGHAAVAAVLEARLAELD